MWSTRVRDRFTLDTTSISSLAGAALDGTTTQERYAAWNKVDQSPQDVEYLVPRIHLDITRRIPSFMVPPDAVDLSADELQARVEQLGPWAVPYQLAYGVTTVPDALQAEVAAHRYWYRLELINGVVARLLGDALAQARVLDIGCQGGLFSIDLAVRGARQVDGVDLRPANIAQAVFAADHYGVDNVSFEVCEVDAIPRGQQWDVVLNLGLLYHVLNPFDVLVRTYELCTSFAIIDTYCRTVPVSAYFVIGDKDVESRGEGKLPYELHPTYRATIDTIRIAGFSEVIELVGHATPPHRFYSRGERRAFLAIK